MLAEDAIKAAVKDYEAKRAKATASGEAATEETAAATAWFRVHNVDDDNRLFVCVILLISYQTKNTP